MFTDGKLTLPQSYDPAFARLLQDLWRKYPPEVFKLEGIHPDQLDIDKVSRNFFRQEPSLKLPAGASSCEPLNDQAAPMRVPREASYVAREWIDDKSIDPNANVIGKDVITFNYEVPKALMKLNSLYNLWLIIKEKHGRTLADSCIEAEISGELYINDAWDIGRPYCFNYSTYDIALEGLKMGGRLTIDPPKSLHSFLRQVEQFTVYAANSTLGAAGLADFLIVVSWYVDRMMETGFDHKIKLSEKDWHGDVNTWAVWKYVEEMLTSFIYTLNWEFRGNQSPFTNVSVYDRYFLDELLPGYKINDVAPRQFIVESVQRRFLKVMNEILARTPVTFPVVTACFSLVRSSGAYDVPRSESGERASSLEGSLPLASADGHKEVKIRDEYFLKTISEANLKYGFINIYAGESSTLSSCCRLRSNVNDLGYSNTFGAGSTKIGSLGVVTLNLPRLARLANRLACDHIDALCEFRRLLRRGSANVAVINNAKREFIADRIKRGSLPLYNLGLMDLSRQYSTCGFTGLHEALEIMGYDMTAPEGLQAAEKILQTINEINKSYARTWGTPHNMEQVPAESSSIKLAQKDALLGYNPEGYELYSNQFLPLWLPGVDLLDRIKVQGALDKHCTGGAILHLNIGEAIRSADVMKALITHAVESGVVYFAANYQINRCVDGHMTVGREASCPACGKEITDTFTRVVGFLTNTKHWHRTRRECDWPNRQFTDIYTRHSKGKTSFAIKVKEK